MKCPACKILMEPSQDNKVHTCLQCGRVITLRDASRASLFPVQQQKRLGWTENVQGQPPDLLGDSSLAWEGIP